MKAIVLIVGVAASSARVVQGQTIDPCSDFNNKKCGKKDECTWNSVGGFCLLTAGTGSVVRDGSENAAPGNYCAVGGGQRNEAGNRDDAHSVIGGGFMNVCLLGSKNTISGGNFNHIASGVSQDFDTISGGWDNIIHGGSYSVITGGGGGSFTVTDDGGDNDEYNIIEGCDTSTVSGGKKNRIRGSGGSGHTISGGIDNKMYRSETQYRTITGGYDNSADGQGQGAVVSGGALNRAIGTNSLAFGQNAVTLYKHSMVVNLLGGEDKDDVLTGTEDGEFLVTAESFRFQIGNGNGNDGNDSIELTKTNMQNLLTAFEEEE